MVDQRANALRVFTVNHEAQVSARFFPFLFDQCHVDSKPAHCDLRAPPGSAPHLVDTLSLKADQFQRDKKGKIIPLENSTKTLRTYNEREHSGTFYISTNTNSVSQGGVVRGVISMSGGVSPLQFEPVGYFRYCDTNAFYTNLENKARLQRAGGLQWVYGEVLRGGLRTGLRGWIPMMSLSDPVTGNPPDQAVGITTATASGMCPVERVLNTPPPEPTPPTGATGP